jgi:threonine aldolase
VTLLPSSGGSGRLRQFASDNNSGICPEVWNALAEANTGHARAYGDDAWTERAAALVRDLFETDCDVFFVFSGTAANALAVATMCRSHQSVLCHELAHLERNECHAPAFFSGGARVRPVQGSAGKIHPAEVARALRNRADVHDSRPRALSLTQATELGTVYTAPEICELTSECRRFGLTVHMDGARLANALAASSGAARLTTWEAGVDVLSLGGTKNGALAGEAVVFFDRALGEEFAWKRKQAGQLASKMRFLAATWIGLIEHGAWLRHAAHANAMATRLSAGVSGLPGATLLAPTEANSVIVDLPAGAVARLREAGWTFYPLLGDTGCRFMCSWDTGVDDVDALVEDVARVLGTA